MLLELHVKNLALIEKADVEFGEGLNILTGETGAGKSLLIGSVNLALGGKFEKDMLRRGEENGLVELVFDCEEERLAEKLKSMDLEPSEDGTVILSRKLSSGKSICRINGETVTAKQVKELSELLIDIHGQHEHQSLLNKKKHMEILDAYAGAEFAECAGRVAALYHECTALEKKITEETLDDTSRSREQSLAEFEQKEIADASLQPGEDEELEQAYRKMSNSRKIAESLAESYQLSGNDAEDGAGNSLSRALRALRSVTMYDPALEQMEEQLAEVESLLDLYLQKTVSVRDTFVRKSLKENFYHGILLGILSYKNDWRVSSNQESVEGFSDIVIETGNAKTGIVIEVKYTDEKKDLERDCRKELEQIRDKDYTQTMWQEGYKKMVQYGIAFH